jgi:hypothetical protein
MGDTAGSMRMTRYNYKERSTTPASKKKRRKGEVLWVKMECTVCDSVDIGSKLCEDRDRTQLHQPYIKKKKDEV